MVGDAGVDGRARASSAFAARGPTTAPPPSFPGPGARKHERATAASKDPPAALDPSDLGDFGPPASTSSAAPPPAGRARRPRPGAAIREKYGGRVRGRGVGGGGGDGGGGEGADHSSSYRTRRRAAPQSHGQAQGQAGQGWEHRRGGSGGGGGGGGGGGPTNRGSGAGGTSVDEEGVAAPLPIGVYTVATFRDHDDEDDDRPSRRRQSAGDRLSASDRTGCDHGLLSSSRPTLRNGRRFRSNGARELGGQNRSHPNKKLLQGGGGGGVRRNGDDDSDDCWMEEALLHGIPAANQGATADATAGEGYGPARHRNGTAGPSARDRAADKKLLPSTSSLLTQRQREDEVRPPPPSSSPRQRPRTTTTAARYRRSRSSDMHRDGLLACSEGDLVDDGGSQRRRQRRQWQRPRPSDPCAAVADLANSAVGLQDPIENRTPAAGGKADALPPPPPPSAPLSSTSADARASVLPTVRTYAVIKSRPDEPAGLFLTRAHNGAVLVHSLSPDSLFRNVDPPLRPGQEVLSVNGKRVNEPKMAAALITGARRQLALRASTAERGRGFAYCQVKRRNRAGGGGGGGGAADLAPSTPAAGHGVRFVTTTVDGVRRAAFPRVRGGTAAAAATGADADAATQEGLGLVRVSRVDPNGLFAGSHPAGRLRVGGIVLAVNGVPVADGRAALGEVMGSRSLVEVLHCDERVWREGWVRDGLRGVLREEGSEGKAGAADSDGAVGETTRNGNSNNHDNENEEDNGWENNGWDLQWKADRQEVTLRKMKRGGEGETAAGPTYAFRLVFDDFVGTCRPELVDDADNGSNCSMMPPADEFDVPLLARKVNDSQRDMMTVLQDMLKRAQFEWRLENGSGTDSCRGSAPVTSASRRPLALPLSSEKIDSEESLVESSSQNVAMRERIRSCDALAELVEDGHGGIDEELSILAEGLLRADDRDWERRNTLRATHLGRHHQGLREGGTEEQQLAVQPRRGSTGLFTDEMLADAELPTAPDVEQWRWEDRRCRQADSLTAKSNDKLREFSARQHKMEETRASAAKEDNDDQSNANSLFSADMLDDFLDYLDDVSAAHNLDNGTASESTQSDVNDGAGSCPPSPRDEGETCTLQISTAGDANERQGDDENAYITGVWRDIFSAYEISDVVVGSGGFGEVRDCTEKKSGRLYVVKTICKPSRDDTTKVNLIRNEILLLHEAHHPNIVELRDLFEDDEHVHIVMERCTGGDLFDRVVSENPRRLRTTTEATRHEARTANSLRSILHVLKYLHSRGIVHRDVKPEHFLLTTEERETQRIKLIDFGLARKHRPGSAPMTTFTGSPSFVAPEVIARRYGCACDMFSTGVTAYFLLTGMLPFDGPTDEETFDLISACDFGFPASSIFLSEDAKDFVTKLLEVDPRKRMSAAEALNHPWLLRAAVISS
ncbi:hypothetical protein ACHAWF_007984 [Thalassiosira exigua]